MIKYVVFIGRTEYARRMFADLTYDSEVLLEKKFSNKLLEKLNIIHTSCKSNYLLRLPFQKIWYKYYLDYNQLNTEDEMIFLLCEENRLCYDANFIKFLKQKYPFSKIVFYAVNSSEIMKRKYVEFIEREYDCAVTFDKSDSIKYGWIYYSGVFSKIEKKNVDQKYDVFFAGNNEGRLKKLHEIYEHLSSKGLKCLFYINGVKECEMLKDTNIRYNQKLTYEQILDFDRESNCILEVLREKQNGTTLRLAESILLGKKLITNNSSLRNERYYNDKMMFIYKSINDINVNFCKEMYCQIDNTDVLSPKKMLEEIWRRGI